MPAQPATAFIDASCARPRTTHRALLAFLDFGHAAAIFAHRPRRPLPRASRCVADKPRSAPFSRYRRMTRISRHTMAASTYYHTQEELKEFSFALLTPSLSLLHTAWRTPPCTKMPPRFSRRDAQTLMFRSHYYSLHYSTLISTGMPSCH